MIGLLRATLAALLLAITALPAAALLPATPGYSSAYPLQLSPLFSYPQAGYSTFYIAPAGTDGTGCGTLTSPCASPNGVATNNFIACGSSQIIALTGTYSQANLVITATPFCPSQVNVVWLRCAVSFACSATTQVLVKASYWGIMGWSETSASQACYLIEPPSTATIGTVAIVNNIADGCALGGVVVFQASGGVGNVVVMGNITHNAATTTTNCDSGISIGSPKVFLPSGDEIYVSYNYTYGNGTAGSAVSAASWAATAGGQVTFTTGTSLSLNPSSSAATAATWAATSGGQVTFTSTSSLGVSVGSQFSTSGFTPSGYNGTWTAVTGTSGTTLVATLVSNPGAETGLGTVYGTGKSFTTSGFTPSGYNGTWTTIGTTSGTTLVASLVSNPGAETGLGAAFACNGGSNSDQAGIAFDTWHGYNGIGVAEGNWAIGNNGPGFEAVTASTLNAGLEIWRNNTSVANSQWVGLVAGSVAEFLMQQPGVGTQNLWALFNLASGTVNHAGNYLGNAALTFAPQSATNNSTIIDANWLNGVTGHGTNYWGSGTSLCLSGQSIGPYSDTLNAACTAGTGGGSNSLTVDPGIVSTAIPAAPSCAGYPDVFACFAGNIANLKSTAAGSFGFGAQVPPIFDQYNTTPFIRNVVAAMPTTMLRTGGGPIPVR